MTTPAFPEDPFTLRSAAELGIGRARVHRAVRDRELRRILRGVFVRADVPDTTELRVLAAARVVPPTSVITDRTAAWIHGVDAFTLPELEVLPPVETCVLRSRARSRRAGVDGGTRDLLPRDILLVRGVRVTTPLRTALDLGCRLRRREALATLDQFMRLHRITREQLAGEAVRYFRRRGVVQLRALIPLADPRAESPRESWVRLAIIDAGLPTPEPQHWVVLDGIATYRLDHAYPLSKVAVEYDGAEFHESPEQASRDAVRRQRLEAEGWTVVVVRKGDFTGEALERWTDELRSALRPRFSNRRW